MVDAVTYILENNATVQGLVGADTSTEQHKVFPVVVFETEKAPYIVVSQISQATVGKNCGYDYGIQVSSYHNSYDEVKALNLAVINAVTGEDAGTVNSENFSFMNFANSADGYDKDHNLYIKITTFQGIAD